MFIDLLSKLADRFQNCPYENYYMINQGHWTWNWRNYINISHRKKVYLVINVRIRAIVKMSAGLLNKLFSCKRYWCNFFCFRFRDLDLYKKISISAKSKGVKFLALLMWNRNFKWLVGTEIKSYIKTNHIQEFLMMISEGPGGAILKFLTFVK